MTHGNDIYWGDPAYRVSPYNRSDFYVNFIQNRTINIGFTYSLHFLEGNVYHEQFLKVNINLGSFKK